MRSYIIRKAGAGRWQVIPADRAQKVASMEVDEAEAERMYNRATTVTLPSRRAALSFIERIGGVWE